jgi:hypothetical protein
MVSRTSDWRDELGRWLKPFLDRLGHKARRDYRTSSIERGSFCKTDTLACLRSGGSFTMLLPNGLLEIGGFQMILSKVERVQHYDGL